ncbi:hypothetical protein R3W88_012483 [Solanum pinnatisectum]|uniref:Retrotransposon gag domain-containing protein n=1 Tax=Solanum pinnatisectum TaxID=50273 RepID=A0AAV9LBT0_9SOLN|nr:hypothetical protein R3W88_012483 [Solanum pinnatisectum]
METGNETQSLIGEITLATLLEVLNNMRGDISMIDGRLTNVEGHQRGYYHNNQGGHGCRDVGINSIKTTLPTFKRECNPYAYLEWESQCDWIFNVNDLAEVKSSCYVIAQFEGYAITWWKYMKRYHLVVQEGHPPPWPELKRLMRTKYVLERYRQRLLAKLYNLRQ